MYNLLEYSDNYADSSGSLYQFKRDEYPMNDTGNPVNIAMDNSSSFKYKSSVLGKATTADGNDRSLKNVKTFVPLKYLSNSFRSLEMPFITCKIYLELNWTKDCVMYGADTYGGGDNANNRETTFKTTSTKLHVPVVTLTSKHNVNLTKQLNEGFKRSVYWNEYRTKIEPKNLDNQNLKRFYLDASFQGVTNLYVLAFNIATLANGNGGANRVKRNCHRKYFLPRVNVINYNVLVNGKNFYDQPVSDQIKKYEIRKISSGFGDNSTMGSL